MEPRSLGYVVTACGAEQRGDSAETVVQRVVTDSRAVQAGDLFFALRGDRFDGHDFVEKVVGQGAAAIVVARAKVPAVALNCAVLVVEDTRQALGRLAARYRADFHLPIVAVGGSNGKTSTKDLLAAVLRQKYSTLWSEASFNNDVGVPVTLLKLEQHHAAAVLEAGTNHPGELAGLLRLMQPQLGVLTSIGQEHLEFFGDLAGVVQEEGCLAELLPPQGKLFVNGDGDWLPAIAQRARAPLVRVGFHKDNAWRAEDVQLDQAGVSFFCIAPRIEFVGQYRTNLLGRHQALNALLAVAAGAELGVSPEEARRGLADCPAPKMRLQIWEVNGIRVLDDCYNANADSMIAALQTLHDLPCAGRRLAVLGDMAELGSYSATAHRGVGRRAAELGVTRLLAVGQWASQTAEGARAAGLQDVLELPDVATAAETLQSVVQRGDLVLLKASRSVGLERVAEALRGDKKRGAR
jgi:UDP-N-acetylmuramoyl-tripeptide--D-alanyl-D-alanine ligase